jgi:hypothetical protein
MAAPARAHWLVIDRLGAAASDDRALPDLNRLSTPPALDFGIRASGARINRVVKGSNAEQFKLQSGDIVAAINNQPTGLETEVAEVIRAFPEGRPLLMTVNRGGQSIRLTGRYSPGVIPGQSDAMFPPEHPSGRVDLVRKGNAVDAKTRGVAAFTLLLSPEQFDFNLPISVTVNGKTVAERTVRRDVATLLKWAARDNDRTMLFGAELAIDVP